MPYFNTNKTLKLIKQLTMERVMSKTQQELLDNTVSYYRLGNRAILKTELQCMYYVKETGISCAIGRELSESTSEILEKEHPDVTADLSGVHDRLPKRLQDMGKTFLRQIQILHDATENWCQYGLSQKGFIKCKRICDNFGLEENYIEITEKRKQEYFNKSKRNRYGNV